MGFVANDLYPVEVFQNYTSLLTFGYFFVSYQNKNSLKQTINFSLKYLVPLIIFIFLPFYKIGFIRNLLFYFLPFMFFHKYASMKYKYVLIALVIFTFMYPGQRISLLYILLMILIIMIQKLCFAHIISINKQLICLLCIFPFFAIFIYIFCGINILDFNAYINDGTSIHYGNESLFDDTRTFIYEESITSLIKHNTWLLGETPAFGYESLWRTNRFDSILIKSRLAEVAIVNIYVWFGFIGLIGYTYLYIYISKKISSTNNKILSSLGVWIAIFFLISWIENCNAWITNISIITYMIMGISLRAINENWSTNELELYIKHTLSTK